MAPTMLRSALLACLFALAACTGEPPSGDDDSSTAPDAGTAAACTGQAYDSCQDTASGSDCTGGMECRFYMSKGFTICSPSCDATHPCPDQDGVPVACNMMGRCRSDEPNACELP